MYHVSIKVLHFFYCFGFYALVVFEQRVCLLTIQIHSHFTISRNAQNDNLEKNHVYLLKETPENKFTKVRNSQRFARSANWHANKNYQNLSFFKSFKNIE